MHDTRKSEKAIRKKKLVYYLHKNKKTTHALELNPMAQETQTLAL